MSTELKRTTIYLPKELEPELDDLRQRKFYKSSQSNMIGHLIKLGMQVENGTLGGKPPQAS